MIPGMTPIFAALDSYYAEAVVFDGTNDYLDRAALSGVSDGSSGTVSMWLRFTGKDADNQFIFDQGALFRFSREQSDATTVAYRRKLAILLQGSGPVQRINYRSGTALELNTWYSILVSWNTSTSIEVYINDVLDTPVLSSRTAGNINYDLAMWVGSTTAAGNRMQADAAEIWMDLTTKIDFTVEANRRLFVNAGGKPVYLGENGELPTGSSPALYLKGPASDWGTNYGTGGNFTVNGTFTDAATSPSD